MESPNYSSSKVNMGLILREKEKSIIDILSRHPSLSTQNRLNSMTEKINLELMLSQSMRSRTIRYRANNENIDDEDKDLSNTRHTSQNQHYHGHHNLHDNQNNEDGYCDHLDGQSPSQWESAINMKTIINQTLVDMKQLQQEKDEIIENLTKQLHEKESQIDELMNRASTIKHYSNLLIRSSNLYVNKNVTEITESDKTYLLKLTSTLSQYLDGAPIEKKTVAKLVRRASLNAVPFDFKSGGKQIRDKREVKNVNENENENENENMKSFHTVSDMSFSPSHFPTSPSNNSEPFHSSYRVEIPSLNTSPDRNSCQFIYLADSLEEQCDYLFYRVYTLSHPNYVVTNKEKSSNDLKRDVLNEWIGKKTFISMCLALDVIDDRLTIQAVANSFDKAAQEASRSVYKLNNRLYLNDFLSALSYLSAFKYSHLLANEQESVEGLDVYQIHLPRLIESFLSSSVIQDGESLTELLRIFDTVSDSSVFQKLTSNQLFLLKSYRRAKNYSVASLKSSPLSSSSPSTSDSFTPLSSGVKGCSGRNWPVNTASTSKNKVSSEISFTNSNGFYHFCRVYRIFPHITRDTVVRRISQHVNKLCPEGTSYFLASLIYLCFSLAQSHVEVKEHEKDSLNSRVVTVMERIICQVEGISLTSAVGQVPDNENSPLPQSSTSSKPDKKREETRKVIARSLLS